jgi:hypothetical protein
VGDSQMKKEIRNGVYVLLSVSWKNDETTKQWNKLIAVVDMNVSNYNA